MSGEEQFTRGERTRQAILDAAEQLFLEQGYHATSMRQIASQAGIAVGGVYNHFAGKEAIFVALLEQHQPYTDILTGLAGLPDADLATLIESAARLVTQGLMDDPVFIRLVLIDIQEFQGHTLLELANRVGPALLAFVGQVVASGQIRPEILPPVLMRTFASIVVFYALSQSVLLTRGATVFGWPPADEIDWIGGMIDVFLNGVLRKSET